MTVVAVFVFAHLTLVLDRCEICDSRWNCRQNSYLKLCSQVVVVIAGARTVASQKLASGHQVGGHRTSYLMHPNMPRRGGGALKLCGGGPGPQNIPRDYSPGRCTTRLIPTPPLRYILTRMRLH